MSIEIPHVLIKANAGSGKTTALSNRFISLLLLGESPDKILATTFTKLAAGEISRRVFTSLAKAANGERDRTKLAAQLGLSSLTEGELKKALRNLVNTQHRLLICTMDSFCVQVAKLFGLEFGLPPGWKILDTYEESPLIEEAIRQMIEDTEHETLLPLVRLLSGANTKRSIHNLLEGTLRELYYVFRNSSEKAWKKVPHVKGLTEKEWADNLSALQVIELPKTKAGKPNSYYENRRVKDLALIQEGSWDDFFKDGISRKILDGETSFGKAEIPADLTQLYRALIRHGSSVLLTRLGHQTEASWDLLRLFDLRIRECKRERLGLTFSDIKYALTDASRYGNIEHLFFRLDSRVRHILLDEFQDTSADEWRVLLPLADEILSGGTDPRSFFCVGDVKQAIYQWRGGDRAIFESVEGRYKQLTVKPLSESYRSAPEIIECVNRIYGSLGSNPALSEFESVAQRWQGEFVTHSCAKKELAGYIEYFLTPPSEGRDDTEFYRSVAKKVAALHREAPALEIGVLVRTNKVAGKILYELMRPELDIRASDEGGNPLTDSPAVAYLLSLLCLADHPGDEVSALHLAGSPLGNALGIKGHGDIQGLEKISSGVRAKLMEVGYGNTLSEYAEYVLPACEPRDAVRVLQLIDLAHTVDARGVKRPSEFVLLVQSKKIPAPGGAKIKVMSIHKSKGLEFDAVFFPELDYSVGSKKPGVGVLAEREDILDEFTTVIREPSAAVAKLHPTLERLSKIAIESQVSEELSVLYVALTRPRHALYLVGEAAPEAAKESEKKHSTYEDIVRSGLGIPAQGAAGIAYSEGDPQWFRSVSRPVIERQPLNNSVILKASPKERVKLLPRRSPSGMEGGGVIELQRALSVADDSARIHGDLFHKFFETVEWLDDGVPSEATLAEVGASVSGAEAELKAEIVSFRECLSSKHIDSVLRRSRYSVKGKEALEVWREHSFAIREEQHLLTGSFDRVVLTVKNGKFVGAEIIDFKTDYIGDGAAFLEEKVEYYRPQMEAYKHALATLTGLSKKDISAVLLFIRSPEGLRVIQS